MKIAVVTPTLESFGGTAQCAKACIEALEDKGIAPDIYTYGFKRLVLYNGILKNIRMLFEQDYDYIFDFTNVLSYNKRNYFNYVHFPEYIVQERGKYNKGMWKLYYLPKRILNPLSRKVIRNSKIDFACNSKFTARRVYETTWKEIEVIYPPCNIDMFKNRNKKLRQVVSVGGFTNEKNQLMQVEIARSFPKVNFEMCGSATRNPNYLFKVYNISKDLKNVNLNPNVLFDELREKLTRSLIFLHTSEAEPFGISTVEAISAGCIPIVHDSGGQKEVVPFRELRFSNQAEAAEKIKSVLKMSSNQLRNYRRKLQRHIKQFDVDVFKKRVLDVANI